jgi:hypothetical protein
MTKAGRIAASLAAAALVAGVCAGCGGHGVVGESDVQNNQTTVPPLTPKIPQDAGPAKTPGPVGSSGAGRPEKE